MAGQWNALVADERSAIADSDLAGSDRDRRRADLASERNGQSIATGPGDQRCAVASAVAANAIGVALYPDAATIHATDNGRSHLPIAVDLIFNPLVQANPASDRPTLGFSYDPTGTIRLEPSYQGSYSWFATIAPLRRKWMPRPRTWSTP